MKRRRYCVKTTTPKSTQMVEYYTCNGCQTALESQKFYACSLKARVYLCKKCSREKSKIREKSTWSSNKRILRYLRVKSKLSRSPLPQEDVTQTDVDYLMENVWKETTALGQEINHENISKIVLVGWRLDQPWTPWNIVCMTRDEARAHISSSSASTSYPDHIVDSIEKRLDPVRAHYEELLCIPFQPKASTCSPPSLPISKSNDPYSCLFGTEPIEGIPSALLKITTKGKTT